MRAFIFAFILLSTVGCASIADSFVFNGASAQTIQTDINHVFQKLSRKKRIQFLMALMAIQFSDVSSVYDFLGDPTMAGMNYDILRVKLDGLTYEQVLELASKSKTKVTAS